MLFTSAVVALAGLSSLAASAPAPVYNGAAIANRRVLPLAPRAKALKHDKRATVIVQQTVIQPQVTIVEENLDLVSQLALVAEQEFSALVQAELALIQEVETIKNNIRINHFRARFSQVNTVIVCVTQVIDLRGGGKGRNTRYMVNQLLADNGRRHSSVVVMVTAANAVTIGAAQPTLDLAGLLGANSTAALPTAVVASVVSSASAVAGTGVPSSSSANVAGFDASNPFGQLNQTVILPYGSKAPSLPNAQVVADPASIILPNQNNLIIEDISQFSRDCQLYSKNKQSFFNLQSALIEAEAIAALELGGLSLGSAAALNAAAAAGILLGGSGGSGTIGGSGGIGAVSTSLTTTATTALSTASASAGTTTTTASSSAVSSSATTSSAAAASATAAVAAGAAVVAPAASTATASAGGVGIQIVAAPTA